MTNSILVYNVPYHVTMRSEDIRVMTVIVSSMIMNLKWNINMTLKIAAANKNIHRKRIQVESFVKSI
jgi:hypothetical protein